MYLQRNHREKWRHLSEHSNSFVFYEKSFKSDLPKDDQETTLEKKLLEVSSLSHYKLKNIKKSTLDSWAYRLGLQLVSSDYTAGFVSHGQYEQLLFVLGQVPQKVPRRSCKEILTLFNDFPTAQL